MPMNMNGRETTVGGGGDERGGHPRKGGQGRRYQGEREEREREREREREQRGLHRTTTQVTTQVRGEAIEEADNSE